MYNIIVALNIIILYFYRLHIDILSKASFQTDSRFELLVCHVMLSLKEYVYEAV